MKLEGSDKILTEFSVFPVECLCLNFPNCSLPFVSGIREILKVRLGEYDVSTTAEPLRYTDSKLFKILKHKKITFILIV